MEREGIYRDEGDNTPLSTNPGCHAEADFSVCMKASLKICRFPAIVQLQ
jgi:hypothetical protein